jgi:hypothetical protein
MYINQRGGKQVFQPSTVKPAHAVSKTSLIPPRFIEVAVPSQESG